MGTKSPRDSFSAGSTKDRSRAITFSLHIGSISFNKMSDYRIINVVLDKQYSNQFILTSDFNLDNFTTILVVVTKADGTSIVNMTPTKEGIDTLVINFSDLEMLDLPYGRFYGKVIGTKADDSRLVSSPFTLEIK